MDQQKMREKTEIFLSLSLIDSYFSSIFSFILIFLGEIFCLLPNVFNFLLKKDCLNINDMKKRKTKKNKIIIFIFFVVAKTKQI